MNLLALLALLAPLTTALTIPHHPSYHPDPSRAADSPSLARSISDSTTHLLSKRYCAKEKFKCMWKFNQEHIDCWTKLCHKNHHYGKSKHRP